MGSLQIKGKSTNSFNLNDQPKITLTLEVDVSAPILPRLQQLTNWSLSEIKQAFKTFQRISQSPVLDSFLFNKIMPLSKKNCDVIFYTFTNGHKYVSVYELIGVLILTSYQTYRSKLQFIYLLYDLDQSGLLHGRQILLIFESIFYGFCRLTGQKPQPYSTVSQFTKANFFSDEEIDFAYKEINLRRLIDEYEGNKQVANLFNRFEQENFREIKENYPIFMRNGLKSYSKSEIDKIYRILYKIYAKDDYQQIIIIQNNRQFRRQNRRDDCYKKLMENKQLTPLKKSVSLKQSTIKPIKQSKSTFRLRKLKEEGRGGSPKQKLIFLGGKTYSKNEVFETISYFRSLADTSNVIKIKEFFKKFDQKEFLKKQISSIFKFLDGDKKGQITLLGFFRSFYPGVQQGDIKILKEWFENYQEIYEADSLARNQPKVVVMSDARVLPHETLIRLKQIFHAMDMGNKGYLNFEDLRKAYRVGFTADQIEKMLRDYGKDNRIRLGGLCKMMLPVGWVIEGVDLEEL